MSPLIALIRNLHNLRHILWVWSRIRLDWLNNQIFIGRYYVYWYKCLLKCRLILATSPVQQGVGSSIFVGLFNWVTWCRLTSLTYIVNFRCFSSILILSLKVSVTCSAFLLFNCFCNITPLSTDLECIHVPTSVCAVSVH